MSKIIVTGGAGFIGSHIVDALVLEGNEVHIVDNMSAGREENINPKAIFHNIDIREKDVLVPIFKDAEYVFHEAAFPRVQYSIENPIETNEINVVGTLNVLEASRLGGVKRLMFASSSAIYGEPETLPTTEDMKVNPLSPYGAQKYIGEIYLKLYSEIYNLETVCLRYFNVYGPRQNPTGAYACAVPRFVEFLKKGESLPITGDGEQTRDLVNVRDIVCANLLAMKSEKVGKGEIINIGSSTHHSVNKMAELVGGKTTHIPPRIEPRHTEAGIEKAKELLGWTPSVNLEEGIMELKKYNNI